MATTGRPGPRLRANHEKRHLDGKLKGDEWGPICLRRNSMLCSAEYIRPMYRPLKLSK